MLEDDEEAVTGGVQDTPFKALYLRFTKVVMLHERAKHRLAVLVPEAGGVFDVGVAEDGVDFCRIRRYLDS